MVDGVLVKQADSIPLRNGLVTIRFIKGDEKDHGIRLSVKRGWIELSDGSHVKGVDTWRAPDLPDEITYRVSTPDRSLVLWNIYRTFHPKGAVTEDMWTGNAGLVVLSSEPNKRTYGFSRGGGSEFDPDALVVEVEWKEQQ